MSKKRQFTGDDDEVNRIAMAAWDRLKPNKRAFCEYYIVKSNGAEAAKQAGYSAKTAKAKGSQLLTLIDIQDVIEGLQGERSRLAIMSFDQRAQILSRIAEGTVASMLVADKTNELDGKGVHKSGPALGSISHSKASSTSSQGDSESERWSVKTRDPIAAIHELNLMFGDHAPKRLQIEEEGQGVDDFTDAELQAFLIDGEE